MKDVFIVSAVRTAIGNYGGELKAIPAHRLAAIAIAEAIKRAGVSPVDIDEVIMGEVRNSEATNLARVAALAAGLPVEVPAYTVNRLCASALQALKCGFEAVREGEDEVLVVGGVENMSRAPVYVNGDRFGSEPLTLVVSSTDGGRSTVPPEIYGRDLSMILTAQTVADKYNVSREDQDLFALRSQQRYAEAASKHQFKDEIIPVEIKEKKATRLFDTDEFPRLNTTLESLARLKPVFTGGSVTAGNACGRNDGASALVIMSGEKVKERNLKPLGRVLGLATTAISPEVMGVGPISAVRNVLKKTGKRIEDIDLIELNEAFASQSLAVMRELGLDPAKVNVNGGAIALGHPLGCTGTRLIVTLLHEMNKRKVSTGLATLCVGGGQGMAAIVENVNG
jgi:acetyl-CoA C-acetyltransferase